MKNKIVIGIIIVAGILIAGGIYLDKHKSPAGGLSLNSLSDKNDVKLEDQGPAPEFAGISTWLNSDPLTVQKLKGKVVLVDFWTYSCINCIRTLPYVTGWYEKYKDQGLVVVGIHTPEFAFEKDTNNVKRAIQQFNITYPVGQDNDYGTWNNFDNHYWPAEYLIDKNGDLQYTHFGEGNYDHTENAIRELLGLNDEDLADTAPDLSQVGSPEMYFGQARLQYLASQQTPSTSPKDYTLPTLLNVNTFPLEGSWQFDQDKITLLKDNGKIKLKFHSGKVHIVASSDQPVTLNINVDGKDRGQVTVSASQLYTLFDSNDYIDHVIEISIPAAGFHAFTFTFG